MSSQHQSTPDVLRILEGRGYINDVTEPERLREVLRQPITLYCGYDPTAPSLHIGHLVTIMMLAWFQRCGHRPIALVGGGTTLVGDPSFREASRPLLSEDQIERNVQAVKRQIDPFLDFEGGRALLLNNADWLSRLKFLDFMREIGARFSVNEVLRLEAYRTRREAGGLSFLEFGYVLLQAYDFLHLFREWNCVLQIGGSDQWGNSLMGADLIRRVTGKDAFVITAPLIESEGGAKMGKSAAGAVWLDMPAYDYYQWWRNTADSDVERFLSIFTFLPMDVVRRLGSRHGEDLNEAKQVLAYEATRIRYGPEAANEAQEAARAVFGGDAEAAGMPTVEISRSRFGEAMPVTELFKEAGLAASANEVRSLIKQGGIAINGAPITDVHATIDLPAVENGGVMLSRGKKQHKRLVLV